MFNNIYFHHFFLSKISSLKCCRIFIFHFLNSLKFRRVKLDEFCIKFYIQLTQTLQYKPVKRIQYSTELTPTLQYKPVKRIQYSTELTPTLQYKSVKRIQYSTELTPTLQYKSVKRIQY